MTKQCQPIVQFPALYREEIMPKLVCSSCQSELKPLNSGVKVFEYAGEKLHKIWCADEWHCPSCGLRVVSGFGASPLAVHYETTFAETLKRVMQKPELVRYNYEWQNRKKI